MRKITVSNYTIWPRKELDLPILHKSLIFIGKMENYDSQSSNGVQRGLSGWCVAWWILRSGWWCIVDYVCKSCRDRPFLFELMSVSISRGDFVHCFSTHTYVHF